MSWIEQMRCHRSDSKLRRGPPSGSSSVTWFAHQNSQAMSKRAADRQPLTSPFGPEVRPRSSLQPGFGCRSRCGRCGDADRSGGGADRWTATRIPLPAGGRVPAIPTCGRAFRRWPCWFASRPAQRQPVLLPRSPRQSPEGDLAVKPSWQFGLADHPALETRSSQYVRFGGTHRCLFRPHCGTIPSF
jgi:hypothetical protein